LKALLVEWIMLPLQQEILLVSRQIPEQFAGAKIHAWKKYEERSFGCAQDDGHVGLRN
jgi:hypothetical protein